MTLETRYVTLIFLALLGGANSVSLRCADLRIGVFATDATPPIGSQLAYDPVSWIDQPLSARGVVIQGAGRPIVLCAVDWIGIANEGQDAWKQALSEAVGTMPNRVVVHTLHQHDAPICDFSTVKLLIEHGIEMSPFDSVFARETIAKAANAAREALRGAILATHYGIGSGEVRQVASNRRILGPDGSVVATRWTATRDPELRDQPVGEIDPMARMLTFWNGETPIVALTYYATHPQSFYRTGGANPDFPGIARDLLRTETGGVSHVHFNGAGGDIGAGKWNDGSPENRVTLALRLADGFRAAWKSIEKRPLSAEDVEWKSESVNLQRSEALSLDDLWSTLKDPDEPSTGRVEAARHLAWAQRIAEGTPIRVSRLRVGDADILHLPGEAVVAYQLAAQSMAPERFVAVAAYGDYGPGYICMREQYEEGGYEASARASRVAPDSEEVLLPVMRRLLEPDSD